MSEQFVKQSEEFWYKLLYPNYNVDVQQYYKSDFRVRDDSRAHRVADIFPFLEGELTLSYILPGAITAWHRHKEQTDYWIVVKGHLRVGLQAGREEPRFECLNEFNPRVLQIPPLVWHGHKNLGNDVAVLLYYTTHKYNLDDEERIPWNHFGESLWEVEKK